MLEPFVRFLFSRERDHLWYGVIHLQRGVVKVEALLEHVVELSTFFVAVPLRLDQYVDRERRKLRSHFPHVKVVDLYDAWLEDHHVAYLLGLSPLGAASKKTRPDSFTDPYPARSMSAATTSAAITSTRWYPPVK